MARDEDGEKPEDKKFKSFQESLDYERRKRGESVTPPGSDTAVSPGYQRALDDQFARKEIHQRRATFKVIK